MSKSPWWRGGSRKNTQQQRYTNGEKNMNERNHTYKHVKENRLKIRMKRRKKNGKMSERYLKNGTPFVNEILYHEFILSIFEHMKCTEFNYTSIDVKSPLVTTMCKESVDELIIWRLRSFFAAHVSCRYIFIYFFFAMSNRFTINCSIHVANADRFSRICIHFKRLNT